MLIAILAFIAGVVAGALIVGFIPHAEFTSDPAHPSQHYRGDGE